MVHVLLLVLKVLGITLLILLGLILLLILLVILVPFYYSIDAEYYGDINAVGRIRWLCFVLDLKGVYGNDKFLYYLKSFGFTISTNDENDKNYHKGFDATEKDTQEYKEAETVPVKMVEDDFESFVEEQEKTQKSLETREQKVAEIKKETIQESSKEMQKVSELPADESQKSEPLKRGIFRKIQDKIEAAMEWVTSTPMRIHYKISEILSRILDFLANLKENINKLIKKRDVIIRKISAMMDFLQRSSTKKAWKDIRQYLLQAWKHVRPRKYHGIVRFGMEDPSTTGQVLGIVAMMMPIYKNHIVVAPDFEQQIFEGEIYAKGRVQVGFILTWILKIILNRNLMLTIQRARTILGGNK